MNKINILGVEYEIIEQEIVNKFELRYGEVDLLECKIRIDSTLPLDKKRQVLIHEVLHVILESLGYEELGMDEQKVQSIATALHLVSKTTTIFS